MSASFRIPEDETYMFLSAAAAKWTSSTVSIGDCDEVGYEREMYCSVTPSLRKYCIWFA